MAGGPAEATKRDLKKDIAAERLALLDLLRDLKPAHWNAASLCSGWRVRDVVAHVVDAETRTKWAARAGLAACRFSIARYNAKAVARHAGAAPSALLDVLEQQVEPGWFAESFGGNPALVEAVVHQLDLRIPLGRPRAIPPETLAACLAFSFANPIVGGRRRTRGVRLTATDLTWTAGEGPEVSGPATAVLLALHGRPAALAGLAGPGHRALSGRLGSARAS